MNSVGIALALILWPAEGEGNLTMKPIERHCFMQPCANWKVLQFEFTGEDGKPTKLDVTKDEVDAYILQLKSKDSAPRSMSQITVTGKWKKTTQGLEVIAQDWK